MSSHLCDPATAELPFVSSPIHGANIGGAVSLYLRGSCKAEGEKMAAVVVELIKIAVVCFDIGEKAKRGSQVW